LLPAASVVAASGVGRCCQQEPICCKNSGGLLRRRWGWCYYGGWGLLPWWTASAPTTRGVCCEGAWRLTSSELDADLAGARCKSGAKVTSPWRQDRGMLVRGRGVIFPLLFMSVGLLFRMRAGPRWTRADRWRRGISDPPGDAQQDGDPLTY
jgi:hypothetical protein